MLSPRADDVAAGDVAELVRDHALHFVGVLGGVDQARMDVDPLAARDEGVDRGIVDQHDLDVDRARGPEASISGRGYVVQQRLGLGVAQDRLRRGRLRDQRQSRAATASEAGKQAHRQAC